MKKFNNNSHNHLTISGKLATLVSIGWLIGILGMPTNSQAAPKKPVKAEAPAVTSNFDETSCLGNTRSPGKLVLPVGKSTLLQMPEPITYRTIGNPDVVQTKKISAQTLYLLGVNIGTTNMIIQSANGNCTIVDVTVGMDPDGLQQALLELIPEEKNIKVTAAADSLVLSGTVEDAATANRVLEIASAFVRRQAAKSAQSFEANPDPGAPGGTVVSFQQGQGRGQNAQNLGGASPRVINLLSISAQQQVMLEVKIAEVSKSLLDKLGVSGRLTSNSGGLIYSLITNFFATTGGATGGTLGGVRTSNDNGFTLDAEKRDGLVKILAEPTVMAISGQEGSFLAGGKIFIPVSQTNNGGVPTITLEEKEFGVGLKFIPTVLAGGRINIKVSPEVSELDRDGIGINASGISGTAILPSFTVRRASTTVQLYDGQTFAIGGLIKNNTTANIKAFPILGEIPILGALFRSTDFQKDRTELIFVVTPRLVKPLTGAYKLPTDNYTDPSRTDIFLNGRMEGTNPPVAPGQPAPETPPSDQPALPAKNEDAGFELE
ncbi:MAG: type II and III secretion system protein family protein [Methylophilaceae bacterium]